MGKVEDKALALMNKYDKDPDLSMTSVLSEAIRFGAKKMRDECLNLCHYDDGVMPTWDNGEKIYKNIKDIDIDEL